VSAWLKREKNYRDWAGVRNNKEARQNRVMMAIKKKRALPWVEKSDYGHDRRGPQSLTAAVEGTDYAFNAHTEKKKTGKERCVQSLTITQSLFLTCFLFVQITSLRRVSGKFPSSYSYGFVGSKVVSNLHLLSLSSLI
jgi:hypothetical protein